MERYTSKKGPRNAAGGNRDGEHCPQRVEEERNRAPMHPEGSPNTPKGTPRDVFFASANKNTKWGPKGNPQDPSNANI